MKNLPTLLKKKALLPLMQDIVSFISELRAAYFFEFEVTNSSLVLNKVGRKYEFILVNQGIPLAYRSEFFEVLHELYDEREYEMNDRLILKKIATYFVLVATGVEMESFSEMLTALKKWKAKSLVPAPESKEQALLLDIALTIVKSLTGSKLMTLAAIIDLLAPEHDFGKQKLSLFTDETR